MQQLFLLFDLHDLILVLFTAFFFMVATVLFQRIRKTKKESQTIEESFDQTMHYGQNWEYFLKEGGVISYMSLAVERLTGYKRDVFVKDYSFFYKIIHPDDISVCKKCLGEAFKSDEANQYDFRLTHKNGEIKWFQHSCHPIYTKDQTFLGRRVTNSDITDQVKMTEALRLSERYFRSITEVGEDVIFRIDPEGVMTYVSPSVSKMFGYSQVEIVGKHLMSMVLSEDIYLATDALRQLLTGKIIKELSLRLLKKDGTYFYSEINVVPLVNNNIISEIQGVIHNTNNRKIAEEKLLASEKNFRRLVESLNKHYFFYTHDVYGVFNYISPSLSTILGYTAEEFCTHFSTYLTKNPINLECNRYTEMSIKGIVAPPYEVEIYHKDGTIRLLEVMETPIFESDNVVVAVEGVARDITTTRRAERLIADKESRFSSLVENLPGVIFRYGKDEIEKDHDTSEKNELTCLYMSDYITSICGYPASDFMRDSIRSYHTIIHPDDFMRWKETIAYATAKNQNYNIEYRLLHHSGEICYVSEKGKVDLNFIDGILFDITEQRKQEALKRQMEAQILYSERLVSIGTLSAGVAHELNNPLTVVCIGLEELDMRLRKESKDGDGGNSSSDKEEILNILEKSQRCATRMAQIISHMRSFTGNYSNVKEIVDVHDILNGAFILCDKYFKDLSVTVIKELANEKLSIFCDKYKIEQVLINLLINANDALLLSMIKQITIKTGITTNNEFVTIEIVDTGTGISHENRKKIFDPFFTTKDVGQGKGLGLFVAQGTMRSHGGELYLKSSQEGMTSFVVTIPLARPRSPS